MQKRRSRTEMLRSSPFDVRSSMKITLPTNVYAGLQTPTEMPEPDARLFQFDSYWDCRGGLYRPITRKRQYPKCCLGFGRCRPDVISQNDKLFRHRSARWVFRMLG